MARYRKRPVEIEAHLWTGQLGGEMRDFLPAAETGEWFIETGVLVIKTLEGEMRADPGDFIIRGVEGEFYPCKPRIFHKTYELVKSPKEEPDDG